MQNWKKNILLFITGQTISLFGSMLVQYAITWYITLETRSGTMMMISILCGFLPQIFLSPFAGVWADRFDRKKLIVLADSAIAIVSILTAFVFLLGVREIAILFIVSVLRSLGQAIHSPAVSASYPKMVPAENLMKVQGFAGGIQSATMIIAPVAGAALLSFTSLEVIFSIDFLTAAIAVFTLMGFVRIPQARLLDRHAKIDYLEDIRLGLRYIRDHPFLVPFFLFSSGVWFFISPVAFLTPLQVVRNFGDEVWRLSAIEIAFSAGMALGGLAVGAIGGFKNRMVTMVTALCLLAGLTIALGVVGNFWVYLAIMVCQGLSLPFYNTPAIVLLQEKVDHAYMGRVFSVMGVLSSSVMPLGMLVFGPLGDAIDIGWLLIGSGIILIALGGGVLMNRSLMKAGSPIPVSMNAPSEHTSSVSPKSEMNPESNT